MRKETTYCYATQIRKVGGMQAGATLAIIESDKSGYHPLEICFDDLTSAQECADFLNKKMGIETQEAD